MPNLVANVDLDTVEVVGRLVIRSVSDDPDQPSAVKTRHSFDFPVTFPKKVLKVIEPLFARVVAEVRCEKRSWADWASAIQEATDCEIMRSWCASIAWFDFGKDSTENELTELITPLPLGYVGDDKELQHVLGRMGYPSPEDRVRQLPVAKKTINRALRRLGQPRVTVNI
ncbi:MAG: hypothetical protein QGF59_10145 [Pirellulaceae bacterium]|nr:hypothetical protein [Pirellulaceae bacterium]